MKSSWIVERDGWRYQLTGDREMAEKALDNLVARVSDSGTSGLSCSASEPNTLCSPMWGTASALGPEFYHAGDWFRSGHDLYVLAVTGPGLCQLVNIFHGNRWGYPLEGTFVGATLMMHHSKVDRALEGIGISFVPRHMRHAVLEEIAKKRTIVVYQDQSIEFEEERT